MNDAIINELNDNIEITQKMAEHLCDIIASAAQKIIQTYTAGGKVLLIGNGGSAGDAQHIAAELIGRFTLDRKSLPALALTTDTSVLTSLANDLGYDVVFSRQIEAIVEVEDVLVALSTSGNSKNILKGAQAAHSKGAYVIGMTGGNGGQLKNLADLVIVVPSNNTPRIQEAHILIGHIICNLVEKGLFG